MTQDFLVKNIEKFLNQLTLESYVILKWRGSFDQYHAGDDLDLVVESPVESVRQLLIVGNQLVQEGFEIEVSQISSEQVHFDWYNSGHLIFRFDIYSGFSHYKYLVSPNEFLQNVLKSRVEIVDKVTFYVTNELDSMVIKYLEYLECPVLSARKIQHYQSVSEKLNQYNSQFIEALSTHASFSKEICKKIASGTLPTREEIKQLTDPVSWWVSFKTKYLYKSHNDHH